LYHISKALDSNNEMNIRSVQCILQGLVGTCNNNQIRTFFLSPGKRKKMHGVRFGDFGGCSKMVTSDDFNNYFISSDVCYEAVT
jgi:hypothetical protein